MPQANLRLREGREEMQLIKSDHLRWKPLRGFTQGLFIAIMSEVQKPEEPDLV